jgi:hypothetical protein
MKARELRKGMVLGGLVISRVRHGAGSAKGWVYLQYEGGALGRDRIRGCTKVEIEG